MTKTEKILRLYNDNPGLTNRDIATAIGCTRRLVRMTLNPIRYGSEVASPNDGPKILLFDIETAPMEVYTWGIWKQTIYPQMIKKPTSVLSWAAKWLFDSKIYSDNVTVGEAQERKDSSILQGIWNLLNEADIVIGHNANSFDVKRLNARFSVADMVPPMPYRVIDTLSVSKRVFSFTSFKLDDLMKEFGMGGKLDHDMKLWKQCVTGDEEAMRKMVKYNENDVRILEDLYLKIRPWIKSHPNIALYIDTNNTLCTNCGNKDLVWNGHYFTPAGRYQAFRCENCGAVGRSRVSDLSTEERKLLNISIAS